MAMYRGDYGLALAAWNSGVKAVGVPGRVLHPSFPSLAETVNFVRDILGNAVSYTIPSPQRRDSEFWQPSTVAELEDAFGITLDELLAANPGLSESDLIPGATMQLPGRTIEFAIDVGDSGTPRYGAAPFPWYSDAEGPIYDEVELRDPQERAAHLDLTNEGAFYTVQPGDALVLIAADFETTVAEILELNEQIEDEDEIDAGMQIIIPWSAGWFIARQTDPNNPPTGEENGPVGEAPTGDQDSFAMLVSTSAGGGEGEDEAEEPGAAETEEPDSGGGHLNGKDWSPRRGDTRDEMGRDRSAFFTDPNGNPVQRGREAIFAWGGIQARPVIEKGDGSYLTSGYAKDALWTARRIAEANELGLNTADFWEAKPDDIQGKINQAKLAIARGEVPAAAAIDYAATTAASPTQYSQPSPSAEPDREDYSGGLSPELMEQAKREAWYRARYELAGPTNWTHYWDAARRARGFKGCRNGCWTWR